MNTIGVLLLAAATAGDGFGYDKPGVGLSAPAELHCPVNPPKISPWSSAPIPSGLVAGMKYRSEPSFALPILMPKPRISPIPILVALAASSAFPQRPEYPASRHGGTYMFSYYLPQTPTATPWCTK